MRAVREREKEERRRSGHVWREAQPLLDALAAAGIDPTDFGAFGWASFSTFNFEQAAPIIIEWLPRVIDIHVKEAMVRSLADQPAAQGEGTRRLLAEFTRPEHAGAGGLKWAIGSTVATLATPEDADAIIDILRDRTHGRSREEFCYALVRTRNPRRVDVLIELIDDDNVAGSAIVALRKCGKRGRVPEPGRVRLKLEALLRRPDSPIIGAGVNPFVKREARKILAAIDRAAADQG
jgi:HEAT repeat protein